MQTGGGGDGDFGRAAGGALKPGWAAGRQLQVEAEEKTEGSELRPEGPAGRLETGRKRRANRRGCPMNRKKFLLGLGLFNSAVFVAAVAFLPGPRNYSFSFRNPVERVLKKLSITVPWGEVFAVMLVSLLISAAVYYCVCAFKRGQDQ